MSVFLRETIRYVLTLVVVIMVGLSLVIITLMLAILMVLVLEVMGLTFVRGLVHVMMGSSII